MNEAGDGHPKEQRAQQGPARIGDGVQASPLTEQQGEANSSSQQAAKQIGESNPLYVQLVGNDPFPHEIESTQIARDTLTIERRAFTIAVLGFLVALGVAVFVWVQVSELSHQNQILAGQSESAAASAAIGELNTRTQLAIAKKSAEAAKQSSNAIALQMRPWAAISDACVTTEREYPDVVGNRVAQQTGCGNAYVLDDMVAQQSPEALVWWARPVMTGQTPAIHTKVKAIWCVSSKPDDHPPSFDNCMGNRKPGKSEVIPAIPGEHAGWRVDGIIKNELSREEIQDIAAKPPRKWFYIIGRIDYLEPMNRHPHWTTFCLFYSPHFGWPLKYCRAGNDIDPQKTDNTQTTDPKLPYLIGNPD